MARMGRRSGTPQRRASSDPVIANGVVAEEPLLCAIAGFDLFILAGRAEDAVDQLNTESSGHLSQRPANGLMMLSTIFSIASGFVMAMLDVTVVNVALGDIQQ